MIILKTLYYDDIANLCCFISDSYDSLADKFADISVIAKYDEAKEIIRELLCIGHNIASLDIHNEEFENYHDEYIISLNFEGIWCEKFKRDNGYIEDCSIITYISNECNSTCIPHVTSEKVFAFEIGEPEKANLSTNLDTDKSESTHVSRDKYGVPCGFTKSWVTEENGVSCSSIYSHFTNDIESLYNIAEKFDVKL